MFIICFAYFFFGQQQTPPDARSFDLSGQVLEELEIQEAAVRESDETRANKYERFKSMHVLMGRLERLLLAEQDAEKKKPRECAMAMVHGYNLMMNVAENLGEEDVLMGIYGLSRRFFNGTALEVTQAGLMARRLSSLSDEKALVFLENFLAENPAFERDLPRADAELLVFSTLSDLYYRLERFDQSQEALELILDFTYANPVLVQDHNIQLAYLDRYEARAQQGVGRWMENRSGDIRKAMEEYQSGIRKVTVEEKQRYKTELSLQSAHDNERFVYLWDLAHQPQN